LSKLFQRKLWPFSGISTGYKDRKPKESVSKFFSSRAPLFSRISDAVAPTSVGAQSMAPRAFQPAVGGVPVHELGAFMAAGVIPKREFFNLA